MISIRLSTWLFNTIIEKWKYYTPKEDKDTKEKITVGQDILRKFYKTHDMPPMAEDFTTYVTGEDGRPKSSERQEKMTKSATLPLKELTATQKKDLPEALKEYKKLHGKETSSSKKMGKKIAQRDQKGAESEGKKYKDTKQKLDDATEKLLGLLDVESTIGVIAQSFIPNEKINNINIALVPLAQDTGHLRRALDGGYAEAALTAKGLKSNDEAPTYVAQGHAVYEIAPILLSMPKEVNGLLDRNKEHTLEQQTPALKNMALARHGELSQWLATPIAILALEPDELVKRIENNEVGIAQIQYPHPEQAKAVKAIDPILLTVPGKVGEIIGDRADISVQECSNLQNLARKEYKLKGIWLEEEGAQVAKKYSLEVLDEMKTRNQEALAKLPEPAIGPAHSSGQAADKSVSFTSDRSSSPEKEVTSSRSSDEDKSLNRNPGLKRSNSLRRAVSGKFTRILQDKDKGNDSGMGGLG